jgi:hypothetical protein
LSAAYGTLPFGRLWVNVLGMADIFDLFAKVIGWVLGLGKYAWVFIRSVFLSRAGAAATIMALESQLEVCLRRSETKRVGRFSDAFRFLWVILSKFWDGLGTGLPCD